MSTLLKDMGLSHTRSAANALEQFMIMRTERERRAAPVEIRMAAMAEVHKSGSKPPANGTPAGRHLPAGRTGDLLRRKVAGSFPSMDPAILVNAMAENVFPLLKRERIRCHKPRALKEANPAALSVSVASSASSLKQKRRR